jgi:hypothetical protein
LTTTAPIAASFHRVISAWQLGVATNQQIGEKFGLAYSSVSQQAKVMKKNLNKDVLWA